MRELEQIHSLLCLVLFCFFFFNLESIVCLDAFVPHNATGWVGAPPRGWGKKNDKQSAQKRENQTHTEQNTKPYMENLSHQVIHFFHFVFFLFSYSQTFSIDPLSHSIKLNKQIKTTRVSLLSPTFYWSLSLCCLCQNHNEPWKTTRCC